MCECAVSSLRQPPSSPMTSEAHSRDILTVQAEQEVKPLRSDSLCGDLSSTLGSLPRPRSVLRRGGVCGQTSKENVGTEMD